MNDLIKRFDAVKVISDFQFEVYGKHGEDANDWYKSYGMKNLHDKIYKIPSVSKNEFAREIVGHSEWDGEYHTCSKCKKIIPYIDWCQPYCSGCGAMLQNYKKWCSKEQESKE